MFTIIADETYRPATGAYKGNLGGNDLKVVNMIHMPASIADGPYDGSYCWNM
jgi:hypothetical protein